MAIDSKYGVIAIPGSTIADNEPVFVIRAQDKLAVPAMLRYRELCVEAGSPQRHIDRVSEAIMQVQNWQAENYTQVPKSATPPRSTSGPTRSG